MEITEVETQPMPVTEGFLDFDAADYRPVDVSVRRRSAADVLAELMEALNEK